MSLDPEQKKRVREALAKGDPKALLGPAEVQQFVLHQNWDSGTKALVRALAHPKCDRGTALEMFWLCEPSYAFDRYANLAEAKKAKDTNLETLTLMEALVERLEKKSGFASKTIAYAPPKVPQGKKRRFSAALLEPSPGKPHPVEQLVDLAVEPFSAADRAALDKTLKSAVSALKKCGVDIALTDPPERIVAVLHELSQTPKTKTKTPPTTPALRAWGFLFAEQIHRAFGAHWGVRRAGASREDFLYTNDRAICLQPKRTVASAFEADMRKHFTLEGLFRAFGKVVPSGEAYAKVLSKDEARHLFRGPPGTWPVWGVNWKLNPWP